MKCSYCNSQTTTYQQYHDQTIYVSPFCMYHQNHRTKRFTIPNHIPDSQHQLYLWSKYGELTNGSAITKLMKDNND